MQKKNAKLTPLVSDTALKDIVFHYRPTLQAPLPDTFSDIDALNAVGPLKFAEFERSLMPGASGNDVLYAGAGNDIAFGGYGNDIIFGEADDDILQGNSGNDVLLGGAGRDYLYGDIRENSATVPSPGDDYLDGGAEDDVIYGNSGNDIRTRRMRWSEAANDTCHDEERGAA